MTTPNSTLLPVEFEAPLVNPTTIGLYGATTWAAPDTVPRWLQSGVRIRPHNYDTENSGVWGADWCDPEPGDIKDGVRSSLPEPHEAVTVWAFDECDLTAPSQEEVRTRAQQNLRLREETSVEREFAGRLVLDSDTAVSAASLVAAVGTLEEALAATNTVGVIHASPRWAAVAADAGLLTRTGTGFLTPLGHRWVFGGGYPPVLGDILVATSPMFGWRTAPELRETIDHTHNRFIAIAESSVVVGYEHAVAAVTVGP
ncbi:hypothetical protein [Tsukamurella paurometabola]|uniref:Uncharacterized protein n=1 Tax=Tsukamurella paurometabola TaxID=2061 RepID=A0ABS5NHW8_TSUPA|nr:hypothetical protein [Tsukamurella paurometabola]MBS4103894.1 hypothetical protein [Tsukamurella paurometabola]